MRVRTRIAPLAVIALALAGCTDPSPEPSVASAPAEGGTAAETAPTTTPADDWNAADREYAPAALADLEAARSLHDALLGVPELPADTEDLVGSLDTLLGIEITELTELVGSVSDLDPAEPVPVEETIGEIDSAADPGAATEAYLPVVTDLYAGVIDRSTEVLETGASERVHAVASDLADGLEPDLAELRGLAEDE